MQLLHQQSLRHVLGNHGDEWIRALLGRETHVGKRASMCHDSDRRDAVRPFEERTDEPGHVEDLKRSGKDCERFRVFRLRRARLDEPPSQASASALIGQEQPDRPGANDQNIRINCGIRHSFSSVWKMSFIGHSGYAAKSTRSDRRVG